MYLIGKLVLDAIATEKPLITCISGLWKDKHASFPLQELIAVPMFGVLILQDFWGRFAKRNIVPKLRHVVCSQNSEKQIMGTNFLKHCRLYQAQVELR